MELERGARCEERDIMWYENEGGTKLAGRI
jgi:hypothetical protein